MPSDAAPDLPLHPGPQPGEPAFHAPWQARAFALTVHLHAAGLFTWQEWSAALGRHLGAAQGTGALDIGAQPPEAGAEAYFGAWLAALEEMLAARGLAGEAEVAGMAAAWQAAARATPHGQPIVLRDAPA